MRTTLSQLLFSFAALIIGIALAAALFIGAKMPASISPVIVKSVGPTTNDLEAITELATVRVIITDILVGHGEGYRGSWLIKGDALLCCDMSEAEVIDVDAEAQQATIRLPCPRAVSPRVDHEKSFTWSVEKATWIPWRWGDENLLRDQAMVHAQRLVEEAAGSEENVEVAKNQAELAVRRFYERMGWRVAVVWE